MNKQRFNTLRIAGALVLAGLVSGQALAQQTSTATANTQAVVVEPIAIQKVTDLNFGRLASSEDGAITIAASDGARGGATANLITSTGLNLPTRATFTVSGEPNLAYTVSGGTGTINLANGAATALVVTLTGVWVPSKSGAAGITTTGTLPAGGSETLGVGGSLALLAATASGTYTNTGGISLTVNYN